MRGIKKTVKSMLDKKTGCDLPAADSLPKHIEYVSFDIFDTLIKRTVGEPKVVFSLLEKMYSLPRFSDKRILAEKTARQKKGGEVTLKEIYQSFAGVSENDIEKYCEREFEAELSVCVPNERLMGFYRDCVKNRKVILISDMYLPSGMMKQILDKCGIIGYQGLYISCEAGNSKRNGGLYKYVLNDLNIPAKKLVHIGNDFMTDYICAKRAGIGAVKIKTALNSTAINKAVLEVNVDDQNFGGVFALVKNVIAANVSDTRIDIAAIEPFEHKENIRSLKRCGSKVYFIGADCGKLKKQIIVYTKLKKLLKEKKYDCVHIHADTANKLLVSGLAAKRAGVGKVILHSHSSGIDGENRSIKLLAHKVCGWALKYIGTDFAACSDRAAKWMFPNISPERIVMINNGVDLKKFRFDPEARARVRKSLEIGNELLIGHVGRFNYQKNHEYLINVMKTVHEKNCDAKLILVGTGEGEAAAREQVHSSGLDSNVIFYGTSDKVNELMQAMDVFVLPSRFEGLPIVGVEAQAAGLPVIFSDRVTRSAMLTDRTYSCPITDKAIAKWTEVIESAAKESADRYAAYDILKNKGFDIQDTVNSFLELYR